MKTKLTILLLSLIFCSMGAKAQVTIGSEKAPETFSVLEVSTNSTKGGLRLPMLTTQERTDLAIGNLTEASQISNARGLAIFNTDTRCFEFWNSAEWISLCTGEEPGLVEFSNCESIVVNGAYDMDQAINKQSLSISVTVNVTKLGTYKYAATCNGIDFIGEGTFVNLGPTTVNLYVDQSTSTGPANNTAGTYTATVIIAPTTASDAGVTCNNISIKFLKRQDADMVILNVYGDQNNTGLLSTGGNYSSSYAYRTVGEWLTSTSATTIDGTTIQPPTYYSGTKTVSVINVSVSAATLQQYINQASIIWIGASEAYSYGFAQFIKEWLNSGSGTIIITGDKAAESTVADYLGYYIEDGTAANGTSYCSLLPEVFQTSTYGAPFNLGNGLTYSYSGSNCGYIASKKGVVFMRVGSGSYPAGFANLEEGVFLFGDKFGEVSRTSTNGYNFIKTAIDIFAWCLKSSPIH